MSINGMFTAAKEEENMQSRVYCMTTAMPGTLSNARGLLQTPTVMRRLVTKIAATRTQVCDLNSSTVWTVVYAC